jgi:putative endonuclease
MNRSKKGREGEARAAAALEEAGMRIIARNVRCPVGEVDLVALDGQTLVFIEVKAWSAIGIEELQYGINAKKQRRIIETAKYFLFSHREYSYMAVRFDVVFVGPEDQRDAQALTAHQGVVHLASAFMESI